MKMPDRPGRASTNGFRFAAALCLCLPLLNVALAETSNNPSAIQPAKKSTAAKLPDWNGVWVIADFFLDKQNPQGSVAAPPRASTVAKRLIDAPPPPEPKYQGIYLEQAQKSHLAMKKGEPTPDPLADCMPQGLALFWIGPYAFEIIQTPKQINFFQEWNEQTHRVYLDGRKHPDDPDPSFNGHSIGHWEGTTLKVDSVGFTTASFMEMGVVGHSEAMHITESIRPLAADLIEITQTIADPEALSEPFTRTYKLRRKPGMEVLEYVCSQNNRNRTNQDGTTGLILHSGSN